MTDCACTADELVCAHHLNLLAYKQAFARGSAGGLPVMVLRPTLRTFWSEFDNWRKFYLAVLVIGPPAGALFGGGDVGLALLIAAALLGLCALVLLFVLVQRVTLDPANRVVRYRNWRGKTVTLKVDDQMRAAAFRYIGVGVTAFAANLVLWTPTASARLDSRQWGVDQLDSISFVLGATVGGLYADEDIAREFPGVLPASSAHPVRTALIVLAVLLALVIGAAVLVLAFGPDSSDDSADRDAEPTSIEVNGPRPTALPADVTARHDALDDSLKKVLASDVTWTSETSFRPCNEQPGWQRENRYSVQEGARLPDDKLTSAFDAAVQEAGLVPVPAEDATPNRLVLSTEYDSETGAGARAYLTGFEATDRNPAFASASLYTQSDCVVTPR